MPGTRVPKAKPPVDQLRAFALAFPEATEDFPWGERAFKVRGKIFATASEGPEGVVFSFKLPQANLYALSLPFTEPTGYGLGKHGWVTARFAPKAPLPLNLLQDWIEESYRTVAPKALVRQRDQSTR